MLRSGVMWMDRIKNECIRRTLSGEENKLRVQTEMLWTCPEEG